MNIISATIIRYFTARYLIIIVIFQYFISKIANLLNRRNMQPTIFELAQKTALTDGVDEISTTALFASVYAALQNAQLLFVHCTHTL